VEDGEAADTGVEDADGPRIHAAILVGSYPHARVRPRSAILLVLAAAFAWPGGASAATTQELTIPASDGVSLACGLVLPDGSPPPGGWPGLLLFHGLGQTHQTMEAAAQAAFAPAGYASLACDARGLGASGGAFGLDGPRETQDARDLFAWLAARPDVSDTDIGAVGLSLGGGAVWNAAAAGVPFRAIVPAISWTSLGAALATQGVPKSGVLTALAQAVPLERWDPDLAGARDALLGGSVTSAVTAAAAARSARAALPSLTVPTLIVQSRHDFLFDIDQALAAYRSLQGPKRLYLGDLGHAPAPNPVAELPVYLGRAVSWLDDFLKSAGRAPTGGVELAHDPWDGTTTSYAALPPTRTASVALPGTTTLHTGSRLSRGARLTGGPLETFGGGIVTVRYSGMKGWSRLAATVSVAGSSTPVTLGATRLTKPAGVATIRLLDECVLLPRGKRLVVALGATTPGGVYAEDVPAGSAITIGRMTLKLSLLKRAVSG
jgi:predicted acyl esterase